MAADRTLCVLAVVVDETGVPKVIVEQGPEFLRGPTPDAALVREVLGSLLSDALECALTARVVGGSIPGRRRPHVVQSDAPTPDKVVSTEKWKDERGLR